MQMALLSECIHFISEQKTMAGNDLYTERTLPYQLKNHCPSYL